MGGSDRDAIMLMEKQADKKSNTQWKLGLLHVGSGF